MKYLSLFLTTALLVFIMSGWYEGNWAGRGLSILAVSFCFMLIVTGDAATQRILNREVKGPAWPFPTKEEKQK